MSKRRVVTLDKITLHVPHGADPQAILREVTRAIAEGSAQSRSHMRVNVAPSQPGEGPQAMSHRIGRATAARLGSGDGS